jgi:lysophospholipase L1-like esterase
MGSVVCFGDSNTWGCPPLSLTEPQRRLGRDERWTGVLGARLGPKGYDVVEEGLSGRTTVFDDPIEGVHKNGARAIVGILESHDPIDVLIVMLGTNDFKPYFAATAYHSARGTSTLVQTIKQTYLWDNKAAPELLIVAPPRISIDASKAFWSDAAIRCRNLAEYLGQVAERAGAFFLDSNRFVQVGLDGVHLDAVAHRALGDAMVAEVESILGLRPRN